MTSRQNAGYIFYFTGGLSCFYGSGYGGLSLS